MTYLKWAVRLVVLTLVAAFLHYTLPTWDTARITNTDILRQDFGENSIFWAQPDAGQAAGTNRDVRFIYAQLADGKEMVYRNEDTGWGWPPYFKINSSNLQAQASDLVSTRSDPNPQWVAIKNYGWRSEFLSIYPNAVRIKEVAGPDVRVTPWITYIILVLLVATFWAIYVRWRRFWRNRIDPLADSVADRWESFDDDIEGRRNIFQRFWVWITGRRGEEG